MNNRVHIWIHPEVTDCTILESFFILLPRQQSPSWKQQLCSDQWLLLSGFDQCYSTIYFFTVSGLLYITQYLWVQLFCLDFSAIVWFFFFYFDCSLVVHCMNVILYIYPFNSSSKSCASCLANYWPISRQRD